ncbi:hypothetical protein [Glycomyces terrestris]|uniref:Uncharacterized protein n=1 Tax=Glycomyces terrestris TaxID=2493553 RepID=A0A426UY62_9ACTN|nr:hypothetical protein [Glycomyces terrestris]RRR99501.1 hypothetical protein EIW28_12410 [Glycomyces terrestris]
MRTAIATAVRTALVLGVLVSLTGLHRRKRPRGGGGGDSPRRSHGDGPAAKKRRVYTPPKGKVGAEMRSRTAQAKKARPANATKGPDGHYRTPDGKYAGSDGRQQDGAGAERRVIDRIKDRYEDHAYRGPAAATTKPLTGEIKSGPNKGPFDIPAGTPRYYDGFVKRNGKWYGVETKSGSAKRTPQQRAIDEWLNQPGNTMTTSDGKVLHGVITFEGE